MDTDNQLLESYAIHGSERAFRDLVERRINLVHSAALRESGSDTSLAEDITQAVFVELSRNAIRLASHPALSGWLYTCVRRMAANVRRSEYRRQRREQETFIMNQLLSSDPADHLWQQMRPLLDDVMHELNDEERVAVVLRFFEGRSLKEVGHVLGLTENAARMRVGRSLEKLRGLLSQRGVKSTASTLVATLAAGAVTTAPSALASTVATGALTAAVSSSVTTFTMAKLLSLATTKTTAAGTLIVLVAAVTLWLQPRSNLAGSQTTQREQAPITAPASANDSVLKKLSASSIPAPTKAPAPSQMLPHLDKGLALHLPLTTDLRDHSQAEHPIKVEGQVRIEPDGAAFGGGEDWLIAPHIPLDNRPFAIAFWMHDTTQEQSVGLLEQLDENSKLRRLHIVLRKERQPFFGFYPARFISPLSIPTDQEWVHLVFQFTGDEQQIWTNGRLICTRKNQPYQGTKGLTTIGKIPRWSNVPGKNFKGHLRDFRIYQRTLEIQEIEMLANAKGSGIGTERENTTFLNSPALSKKARASRDAMTQFLPKDPSLPFIQIAEQQLTINGQSGQVYTLQSTEDLSQWRALERLTNQTGQLVYPLNDKLEAKRFFRVRVEGFGP